MISLDREVVSKSAMIGLALITATATYGCSYQRHYHIYPTGPVTATSRSAPPVSTTTPVPLFTARPVAPKPIPNMSGPYGFQSQENCKPLYYSGTYHPCNRQFTWEQTESTVKITYERMLPDGKSERRTLLQGTLSYDKEDLLLKGDFEIPVGKEPKTQFVRGDKNFTGKVNPSEGTLDGKFSLETDLGQSKVGDFKLKKK